MTKTTVKKIKNTLAGYSVRVNDVKVKASPAGGYVKIAIDGYGVDENLHIHVNDARDLAEALNNYLSRI